MPLLLDNAKELDFHIVVTDQDPLALLWQHRVRSQHHV